MKRIITFTFLLLAMATVSKANINVKSLIEMYKCTDYGCVELFTMIENYSFVGKQDGEAGSVGYYFDAATKTTPVGAKKSYSNEIGAIIKDKVITQLIYVMYTEQEWKGFTKELVGLGFVSTFQAGTTTVWQSVSYSSFQVTLATQHKTTTDDEYDSYAIILSPKI